MSSGRPPTGRNWSLWRAVYVALTLTVWVVGGHSGEAQAYIYDQLGYAVPAPQPFKVQHFLDFSSLQVGVLEEPQDLSLDADGNLVVADTGNSRLIRITPDGELLQLITHQQLQEPQGVFIVEQTQEIYVADAATAHILRFAGGGTLVRAYPPPSSDVLPQDMIYAPSKVLVDRRGWIYVVGTGTSTGIIQLDPDGEFRGFFGANRAPANLLRRLVRLVATEDQKRKLLLQTLMPTSNFAIDRAGFIYTVTRELENNQIRRLNALGINTYPPDSYGEPNPVSRNVTRPPQLASIDVDERGIITVLDDMNGKISQYNLDGELLFVFAGLGDVLGTFRRPTDLAVDGKRGLLYVLDANQGGIHVFNRTAFAESVFQANALHYDGSYIDALDIWMDVLDADANYPLAHSGLAKAMAKLGRRHEEAAYYQVALDHYRFAGDRPGYSQVFELYRHHWLRRNFLLIVLILAAAIVGVWAAITYALPYLREHIVQPGTDAYAASLMLLHPLRGWDEVRYRYSNASLFSAGVVLALCLTCRVVFLYGTSFHYTTWDPARVSLITEFSRIMLPWFTWCVANWLITLVIAGEAGFGKIFVFSAYALIPYVPLSLALTGLSHLLSLQDQAARHVMEVAMYLWMALLLVGGVKRVHNYSVRGAIGITLLSVISIVLLWGVAVLLYGLVGGFADFLGDVAQEVRYNV